jgi:DNA mismatch repair protein MutS
VPQKVISAARRYLRELERRSAEAHEPRPQQELLLEVPDEPRQHPVVSALQSLDLDTMTPRQAQDALYELKRLIDGAS